MVRAVSTGLAQMISFELGPGMVKSREPFIQDNTMAQMSVRSSTTSPRAARETCTELSPDDTGSRLNCVCVLFIVIGWRAENFSCLCETDNRVALQGLSVRIMMFSVDVSVHDVTDDAQAER
jgi:hypothetical protein